MRNQEIVWNRVAKAASAKRMINALQSIAGLALSTITRKSITWGVPPIVTIEPTVRCNLRCPQCITGMGKIHREQDDLNLDIFKQIMEEIGDRIWYLLLFNQGEPLLHPDFLEFIRLAKQKRIYVTTSTNGHFFEDENFVTKFIASGIDTVIISLDGADSETYSSYRQGGDFQRVLQGIKKLVSIRRKLKSKTPKIFIQCLVTRKNEHQFDHIKKLAEELGVDQLLVKTFQLESLKTGSDFLPTRIESRRYHIHQEKITIKNQRHKGCARLWYSSVILSDGRIVPCCFDKNGSYEIGRIDQSTSFQKNWHSKAYHKFREKILKGSMTIGICHNCTQNQKVYL
ncbi:radical SAM protein [candidate division KSB1 bacterium]|nr:radical SAM protein [candidate division KSB1 bacterium]